MTTTDEGREIAATVLLRLAQMVRRGVVELQDDEVIQLRDWADRVLDRVDREIHQVFATD